MQATTKTLERFPRSSYQYTRTHIYKRTHIHTNATRKNLFYVGCCFKATRVAPASSSSTSSFASSSPSCTCAVFVVAGAAAGVLKPV